MNKVILGVLLCLGVTAISCGRISNRVTRHNSCHARCLHTHNTHNFSQVGSVCTCNPKAK